MIRPCHIWIALAQCLLCVTLLGYFILLNDAYVRMLTSLQQEYRRLDEAEIGTARWSGCPHGLVVTSQHVSRPRDTCEHVWDYLGVWAAAKRFDIFPTMRSETLQFLGKSFEEPMSIRSHEEVDVFCEVLNKKRVIKKALTQRQLLAKLGPGSSSAVDVVSLQRNETVQLLVPLWSEIAYELRLKHELLERAQYVLWKYGVRRLQQYLSGEAELYYVGVHVSVASDKYQEAMEWLRRRLSPSPLVFLVACNHNSMDWCHTNLLQTEDVFFVEPVTGGCNGEQLALFAACNYTILWYAESSKLPVIAAALAEKQYQLVLGHSTGVLAGVPSWMTYNSQDDQ